MARPTEPNVAGMAKPGRGLRLSAPLVHIGVILAVGIMLLLGTLGLYLWSRRPHLSQTEIRDAIYSTIQRESSASFLITGTLEITTTTRVENTRTLLPSIVGLDLGTTSATVRVPGRVSYGIDVRQLTPEMITVAGDTIEVIVPDPVVYSVEPNLSQMEVETRRGWMRPGQATTEEVRTRAIELVQGTMRAQGVRHLQGSSQPRINTADALYEMLRPALVAAGVDDPQIRFQIGRMELNRRLRE